MSELEGERTDCSLECLRCETPCAAWAILREARDWQGRLDERRQDEDRRSA